MIKATVKELRGRGHLLFVTDFGNKKRKNFSYSAFYGHGREYKSFFVNMAGTEVWGMEGYFAYQQRECIRLR